MRAISTVAEVATHRSASSTEHFTAEDFRTWHGTTLALDLTRLACSAEAPSNTDGAPHGADKSTLRYNAKEVLTEVARHLGNTPAVCKKSYVHPAVLALGAQLTSGTGTGLQDIWERIGGTTSPKGLNAAERRLMMFLRNHHKKPSKARKSL